MHPGSEFFFRRDGKPETMLMNQLKSAKCPGIKKVDVNDQMINLFVDWLKSRYKVKDNLIEQAMIRVKKFTEERFVSREFLQGLGLVAFDYEHLLQKGNYRMDIYRMGLHMGREDLDTVHRLIDTRKQWVDFMSESYGV